MSHSLAATVAVFALVFLTCADAHADEIITFTGYVAHATGLANVNAGDSYTQVFTIKSGASNYYRASNGVEFLAGGIHASGDVVAVTTFGGYTVTANPLANPAAVLGVQAFSSYDDGAGGFSSLEVFCRNASGCGLSGGHFLSYLIASPLSGASPITSLNPCLRGPGMDDFSQWNSTESRFEAFDANNNPVSFDGILTDVSVTGNTTAAPEPSSMAALSAGLLGLCALGRCARKRQSSDL